MTYPFKAKKLLSFIFILVLFNCKSDKNKESDTLPKTIIEQNAVTKIAKEKPDNIKIPKGMVWVDTKTFTRGAKQDDKYAMMREKPAHQVTVDGFFIDITEVSNKQFKTFVDSTSYITVAERPINWDEMKKELPLNTKKPHDSLLQPGSLIFNKNINAIVNMDNYSQWWTWKIGANWRHPEGPKSTIEDKDNFPVVHIALEDAKAYCKWANRRLPTEAEWESAAQGTATNKIFTWGNNVSFLDSNANTWQGTFPIKNENIDGFSLIAPSKSYPANTIGIYDMLGNVWEITSDLFNVNYYSDLDTSKIIHNPKGASKSYNLSNPYQKEIVIKGGSFLCHASYCASFRISARMGMSLDSGSDHIGFRTVATADMLAEK